METAKLQFVRDYIKKSFRSDYEGWKLRIQLGVKNLPPLTF